MIALALKLGQGVNGVYTVPRSEILTLISSSCQDCLIPDFKLYDKEGVELVTRGPVLLNAQGDLEVKTENMLSDEWKIRAFYDPITQYRCSEVVSHVDVPVYVAQCSATSITLNEDFNKTSVVIYERSSGYQVISTGILRSMTTSVCPMCSYSKFKLKDMEGNEI